MILYLRLPDTVRERYRAKKSPQTLTACGDFYQFEGDQGRGVGRSKVRSQSFQTGS